MADISTFAEGMAAAEAGANLLSTTLSGYTEESPKSDLPDFELLRRLGGSVPCAGHRGGTHLDTGTAPSGNGFGRVCRRGGQRRHTAA